MKLGAECVAEITADNEKIWMIRINLENPFPSYSMLKAATMQKRTPRL